MHLGSAVLDSYTIRAINICVEAGASISVDWSGDGIRFRAILGHEFVHNQDRMTKLEANLDALERERTGSEMLFKNFTERYIPVLGELEAELQHPRSRIINMEGELLEAISRYQKEVGKPAPLTRFRLLTDS